MERHPRLKILVPIDGSSASLHALDHIADSRDGARAEVLLLNVRPRVGIRDMFRHSTAHDAVEAQRVIGEDLMRPAMLRLDARRIHYSAEVAFGPVAETIIDHAHKRGCDAVYIATEGGEGIVKRLTRSMVMRYG
jgi:nucleotide-binding universal stress UspA family protein